jgi:glutamyl-Q tRNA(Asp) synthetase
MASATPVTRFAPSPTGRLHLGSAHAALFAWRLAREARGRFLLRIEDIDRTRCRAAHADAIMEDLAWLGLDWDGEVRVQSAHFAAYGAALAGLAARGLLYPCFCTRADIAREIEAAGGAPHGADGPLYPGLCRNIPEHERHARIAAGVPHALRLDIARAMASVQGPLFCEEVGEGVFAADPAPLFGDVVLGRKDTQASYHLAVTHDDALQGVTLVTRGVDLKPAVHVHRLLQALMGWPVPRWQHHRLLAGPEGRRLAKRDGALTIAALRQAGHGAAAVRAMAGFPD